MSEPSPADELRASDADREQVVQRLRTAHADGRIDLAELDERIAAAYVARTYGDLAKITADLPESNTPVARASRAPAERRTGAPATSNRGFRGAVTAWLAISLVNLVIWGIVSVAGGHAVYPWWIWVAGPWGAVLLASWIGSRAERT